MGMKVKGVGTKKKKGKIMPIKIEKEDRLIGKYEDFKILQHKENDL